jgi:2-polyprenyl-3-methyl-5-hydroxy-6-metoxy-1,4-benzoquinol methylase
MKTRRQDFEEYARVKPFNASVADTWDAAIAEALTRSGLPLSDVRVLDYGCGDGKYFPPLVRLGLTSDNIHGIEISKLRIERCHALGWKHAVLVEKGEDLPYAAESFDVVNLMEVVEHIPAAIIPSVLREIHRVIRPEGVLIVSTPNYPIKRFYDFYDAAMFRKWKRIFDDPTHVTFYNHHRLRRLLGAYFTQIDERSYKTGFLYRRFVRSPHLMHKMLFLCTNKRS